MREDLLRKECFHGTPTQEALAILSVHTCTTGDYIKGKALLVVGVPLIFVLIWRRLLAATLPGQKLFIFTCKGYTLAKICKHKADKVGNQLEI